MNFIRNILITGGAGFIGSHVVRLFVNKYPEYHIINLDKLTYAGDLASVIYQVIEENQLYKEGIYHFSNEGVCAWYDFAKEVCDLSGNVCDIQPCHSDEFPSKVKRPHFSVLDKTKVKSTFGITVPYWKDSLQKCINELKQQSDY